MNNGLYQDATFSGFSYVMIILLFAFLSISLTLALFAALYYYNHQLNECKKQNQTNK